MRFGLNKRLAHACVLVGATCLLSAGTAAASAKPSLRVQFKGAVVTGSHFHPGELVTVTLITSNGPRTARVWATGGTFRVAFRVPARGCGAAYAVRARGASGSAAHLVFAEPPVCVPPPRD
jgi:hypothetical protein